MVDCFVGNVDAVIQMIQVADAKLFPCHACSATHTHGRGCACSSTIQPAPDMPHCLMPPDALPVPPSMHCATRASRSAGTPELSRRLRTSLCFFWGRANLPLPRKHDILSAVGPTVKGAWQVSGIIILQARTGVPVTVLLSPRQVHTEPNVALLEAGVRRCAARPAQLASEVSSSAPHAAKTCKQAQQEPCNQFHPRWCARTNCLEPSCSLANYFGFIALPSTRVLGCSAMLWGALSLF